MKMVTLEVVAKPKSFDGLGFDAATYAAAKKVGPKRVPYATAREALKNSKGMYMLKSVEDVVPVELKGLADPEEMNSMALVQEMTMWGKPPRKKMKRTDAVNFVRKLREEGAEQIVDDD